MQIFVIVTLIFTSCFASCRQNSDNLIVATADSVLVSAGHTHEGAATQSSPASNIIFQSSDGGKTWQAVEKAVLPFEFHSDHVQMGNQWVCSHAGGISASSDQGKTRQLVLKLEREDSRADLIVADGIIYALMSLEC